HRDVTMESFLFAASSGALVPSLLLLNLYKQTLVQLTPVSCNYFLDHELLHKPSSIHPHLECMGSLGRSLYVDMYAFHLVVFPLTYAAFLFGLLTRIWPKQRMLSTLPIIACVADVLENCGVYYLLLEFPVRHDDVALMVSVCTPIKWFTIMAATIASVVGVARKRRSLGHVPLSGDQVAFLARKDDDARRRERLRQVRLHEKRVAQEVTARYRENLQRLQSEKRQAAHAQQRVQHELLLSDLHRKYQYCLQNMGAAQRNARKKLGELMEQAQAEKTKWVFNRDVVHQRYDYARDEDKLTEALRCARRKEVEANLRRLQELSQRQRVAASERARMEEARKVATEQERVRTLNEYRQATEQEVFTAVRPHRDDIDAYQFTRVHSAPLAATTATRWSGSVRPEVRVIRHNPQHPNATKATTDAMVHRDCVDHLQEEKRRQKEKESEVATARGRHALSQIEADKQGSHVMEWLSQLDEADRIERLRQYENAQFVQHETVKETEGELEESFAQMFGVDDHSSTGQRSVERVMLGEFSVATGSESEVLLSDLSAVSCAELPPQTPKEETNKTPSIKFEQESTHVEEIGLFKSFNLPEIFHKPRQLIKVANYITLSPPSVKAKARQKRN
ncbi:TPA: hypothetical protein N0F65_001755, partial [Lagenidium giganteum]